MAGFFDRERLIHSLKTAIACLIGYFLTRLVGLQGNQWVVITILVVMVGQLYVGSVIQKAYFRFLGTLIGCAMACAVILSGHLSDLTIAGTLILVSFIFSYLATWREDLAYAGTLGAVTTTIILLNQTPTLLIAFERVMEISVGLLIATLVSQFALPIHARTHLRRSQAETLRQLRAYYQTAVLPAIEDAPADFLELDERIVKSLLEQRKLAKESAREPLGVLFNASHFTRTLYAEREMLRAMSFMQNALSHLWTSMEAFLLSRTFQTFNEEVLSGLEVLIDVIENNNRSNKSISLPASEPLQTALHQQTPALSRDNVMYLDGFLFCAESLTKSLTQLAALYDIPITRA